MSGALDDLLGPGRFRPTRCSAHGVGVVAERDEQCRPVCAAAHREGTPNFSRLPLPPVAVGTGLPLLERERELARVAELVETAANGELALAVVEGPAGAGKSAILSALAARSSDAGFRVLRAIGLEFERGYPFGVVRQLFEPLLYVLDEQARSEVFAGAAGLAEELLAGRGAESGPRLADPGFALMHSLYWVLVGLTDLAPLALVVDDVQWADPLSLRFLGFALKRSDQLPLLMAVARRDAPADEQPSVLATVLSGPATVIRPAPLSREAIASLLTRAVGRELDDEVVAEAERLTDGNPLYVRELADSLSSAGDAVAGDPMGILRGAAPAAVGRRVQTELARLAGAAQAIAQAAAVLGEEVPLRHAAALAEVDPEATGVDALARAGILVVGEPLRFRHPLVREAVLGSIEPRARALSHGRAAQLLIGAGEPPERAAVHLLKSDPAGDPEVVSTLRAAAKRALAEAAPELAISALTRALREPPDSVERPLVLKDLALAEAQLGNPDAALEHFEEAFASVGSLEQLADGAGTYAALLNNRGRFAEANALGDLVVNAIADPERRLMLEAELGGWGWEIPAVRERLSRLTTGLHGETLAERLLLGLRACDAAKTGAISAADAVGLVRSALGEGQLLAELGPDSPTYVRMLVELSQMDESDALDRELDEAITEARRRGAWFCLAIASALRSARALSRGRLLSAEADARTGVEIASQMAWLTGAPVCLDVLLAVLLEAGDLDEAERLLDENNFSGPIPEGPGFTELLEVRGRLRIAQGRSELGIKDLEEVRSRLATAGGTLPTRTQIARSLAPALMQVGREPEAREVADEALRVARTSGVARYIADALRARALANAGGPDVDQLREAAAIYEGIDGQLGVARTLLDIGSALRRRRQAAAARDPLRRALDLARACGARPLAKRAEHELRAAGARPRRDRITGRDALTASEQRVAQLAIEGMTNRQIAETLFVTRKTVESHLDHVFRKLGIHARGELGRALAAEDELTPVG